MTHRDDERDVPPPGRVRRWIDQEVIPALVDGAGRVEAVLHDVAERTERSPLPALGTALGVGVLICLVSDARRRRAKALSSGRRAHSSS